MVLALCPLQRAAGSFMPESPYRWRTPISVISLSCDCAADQEQLLPAEHLGKGGCSGGKIC